MHTHINITYAHTVKDLSEITKEDIENMQTHYRADTLLRVYVTAYDTEMVKM